MDWEEYQQGIRMDWGKYPEAKERMILHGKESAKCRKENTPELLLTNVPKEYVEKAKSILPDFYLVDKVILVLRAEKFTLKQISEWLNRSRENIRQKEAKAMRKLRHPSRINDLRQILTIYPNYQIVVDQEHFISNFYKY